jgi:uncharacterized membrane protein YccC
VYENGNLKDFERFINAQGDRVLYVGDHIYGDILRSKKDSAWRTAMIMQEMEEECTALEHSRDALDEADRDARRHERLEDELRYHLAQLKAALRRDGDEATPSAETLVHRRASETLRAELRELDAQMRSIEKNTDAAFHPYWGSLFKQSAELSSFGDQVEEYACLYTARVSNFGHYSPTHFFRSPRDVMPHEM